MASIIKRCYDRSAEGHYSENERKLFENDQFRISAKNYDAKTWTGLYMYADEKRYRRGNHVLGYVKSLDNFWLVIGRFGRSTRDRALTAIGCEAAMGCLTALRRPYFRALVLVSEREIFCNIYLEKLDLELVLRGDPGIWGEVTVDGVLLTARVERIVPGYALGWLKKRFAAERDGTAQFLPGEGEELNHRRFLHICSFEGM